MSFAIKDPGSFSEVIMPQFFSRNKFTSFVRQLNFYGFRKMKRNDIRINPMTEASERNTWRFRHEKFVRGKPEFLAELRRSRNRTSSGDDVHQLKTLKSEVDDLRGNLSSMSGQLENLKSIMQMMLEGMLESEKRKNDNLNDSYIAPHHKRRKIPYQVVSGISASPFEEINHGHTEELDRLADCSSTDMVDGNDAFELALEELGQISPDVGDLTELETGCNKVKMMPQLTPPPSELKPKQLQKMQPMHYSHFPLSLKVKRNSLSKKRMVFSYAA